MSYDTFVYCPAHGYIGKSYSDPLDGDTCEFIHENAGLNGGSLNRPCGRLLYEVEAPYRTGKPYQTRKRGEMRGGRESGYICMWRYELDGAFCGEDVCKAAHADTENGSPELCKLHYKLFKRNEEVVDKVAEYQRDRDKAKEDLERASEAYRAQEAAKGRDKPSPNPDPDPDPDPEDVHDAWTISGIMMGHFSELAGACHEIEDVAPPITSKWIRDKIARARTCADEALVLSREIHAYYDGIKDATAPEEKIAEDVEERVRSELPAARPDTRAEEEAAA